MKHYSKHTVLFVLSSLLVACTPVETIEPDTIKSNIDWSQVRASATIDSQNDGDKPYTKSMVDVYSAQAVTANFLKIDEDMGADDDGNPIGAYTFYHESSFTGDINYPSAYIVNASMTSAADNTDNHLRDVLFRPDLSYKLRLKYTTVNDNPVIDTLFFYHTRMIGWTPKTVNVPSNGSAQLSAYQDSYSFNSLDGKTSIIISDIDLSEDVMFTDLREGQHWHDHTWNHKWENEQNYSVPFGYNSINPHYENFFTFKHYRSAVRIFAEAEQSQQNLSMWGQITSVQLSKQPTKCSVELPLVVNTHPDPAKVVWSEPADQDIVTEGMFGEDPNYADLNIKAEYPISMTGATSTNRVYLGYAMIEPEKDVVVDLHTTSGVYQVTIPCTNADVPEGLFKAGKYYTINLSLQTSGAIAEILEFQSDDEHYFDLTALSSMDNASQSDQKIMGYRYSNCYIVDPASDEVKAGLESLNKKLGLTNNSNKITSYTGYAFSAIHIGNGDAGIIPTKNANVYFDAKGNPTSTIDPASARLVWESSERLITNVELIHTYVRFKVNPEVNTAGLKGNAVIAVYDKENKLLWSWHIWITDTPDTNTVTVNGTTYTFMDRNLGATAAMTSATTATDALKTYGLYYQWGRKDPSVGPSQYNYPISCLNTATYYDFASDPQTSSMIFTETSPTVHTGVQHPMYLVLPSVNRDNNWLGETFTDLWGYDGTRTNKTVYDPCPYGYRVPGEELVTATKSSTGTGLNFGYKVANQFYLPYAGFKGDDKGSSTSNLAWGAANQPGTNSVGATIPCIGTMGDYQSSILDLTTGTQQYNRLRLFVTNQANGFDFWIGSAKNQYRNRRTVDYTNRRTAASVRCVKDETMGGLTATLTLTGGHTILTPGDELSLAYTAHSSGSALRSVTLDLEYYVRTQTSGGGSTTEKSLQRLYTMDNSMPKVSESGTVTYTVKDAEYLSNISSKFRFILTVTNEAGRTEIKTQEKDLKYIPNINITTRSPYVSGSDTDVAKFGTVEITAEVTGEVSVAGSYIDFDYNHNDFDLVGTETVSGSRKTITLRAKRDGVDASLVKASIEEGTNYHSSENTVSLKLIEPYLRLKKKYLTIHDSGNLEIESNTDIAYAGIKVRLSDTSGEDLVTVSYTSGNSITLTNQKKRSGVSTVEVYFDKQTNVNDACQVVSTIRRYWKRATSVSEIAGKTIVIVSNNYIARNNSSNDMYKTMYNMNKAFDPYQKNYDNYTFYVGGSANKYTLRNTFITGKSYHYLRLPLQTNEMLLVFDAYTNNSEWTISYNNGFTITNNKKHNWNVYYSLHTDGNGSFDVNSQASTFQIWYYDDGYDVAYTVKQNTYEPNKYIYDTNDSELRFNAGKVVGNTDYVYHWVLGSYQGKTYLQNVATGRYISDEESGNPVSTDSDYANAKNITIGNDNSIKIGNYYLVAWGIIPAPRASQDIGLYEDPDDRYTFTPIEDYK